ncbi:MAG: hypothetical protein JJU05_14300, partial [Verrucomicrobia bacterium]|nr:hypothetical protein [Verrucomicrobiota bacterium]
MIVGLRLSKPVRYESGNENAGSRIFPNAGGFGCPCRPLLEKYRQRGGQAHRVVADFLIGAPDLNLKMDFLETDRRFKC